MPVESPDLNTYLCLQMDSLAEQMALINSAWRMRLACG